ncbi:hypothetical protein SIAM614_20256 [Stappia aggregata IAM 12614]|uniref:Uncharacterized protein n=1 Tax=Roseibium aggregatum (strain ATCC 25650 / DSM 13394 / JCM 20685 / NBRC 16684 / NCIMB 2208 / IAM 12614 / B1) TaxID=384765 RepID=A0NW28_ROSAI|nr:hypothetical protein SIAM614_20256 [Stappia aggregata IAM 12614] [Roseibium aggregatum IAM 12614]
MRSPRSQDLFRPLMEQLAELLAWKASSAFEAVVLERDSNPR